MCHLYHKIFCKLLSTNPTSTIRNKDLSLPMLFCFYFLSLVPYNAFEKVNYHFDNTKTSIKVVTEKTGAPLGLPSYLRVIYFQNRI